MGVIRESTVRFKLLLGLVLGWGGDRISDVY